MLGVAILVLVIGHGRGDPLLGAFESTARSALGGDANIQLLMVADDPPDDESSARAATFDGVVELSWTGDGTTARAHCYLSREHRWLDREISFGSGSANSEREATERGRLLGFAVATMFAESTESPAPEAPTSRPAQAPPADLRTPPATNETAERSLEFAGQISSGIEGTAGGLGAGAALRMALHGPLWARLFVAGRTGNIAAAQASTRSGSFGGGVALAFSSRRFELGLRADAFASYFEATHLSEDDVRPDRQSRWLPGGDLLAEAGFHVAGTASVFLSGGLEAVAGKTEVFTHGQLVAVVPPLRTVGELGFRIGF